MPPTRLCPNPDLPCAGRAAELLDAVGVHGRPRPPVPQIAAARAERMRSLDPDIARVERERIATFDAVPLVGLQEELRHGCIAVVRIDYSTSSGPSPAPSYILLTAWRHRESGYVVLPH
jgi:hypothetical protein